MNVKAGKSLIRQTNSEARPCHKCTLALTAILIKPANMKDFYVSTVNFLPEKAIFFTCNIGIHLTEIEKQVCNVDGEVYQGGETFSPKSNPKLECYCMPGYTGISLKIDECL
ncbi:hypothetical protein E2986_13047 [Frieseomelitta varia]|uniref:Sushi domain-containing protein n=1 Tax=Frieseomelitta varia TaxID=561572 RepID=A0A833RHB9_9HYME|nr:hypothetical protein E2986_13047 [Frieseomelitta varia]